MKKLQDYIKESEQWVDSPAAGDDFAINIREECLVESHIVDVVEDGIVLAADDKMMSILENYGMLEDQGVAEGKLNEFDPGEGGFGPFKIYVGNHFIDKFGSFDEAREEIEFLRSADPKSAHHEWKIIDGTGETVWKYDPGEVYDQMRRSQKFQFKGPDSKGVAEGVGELSIQQLATISDEALDKAYGYGRSSPGNTFGWQANLMSAAYAKKMIDAGITDIEKISDAIHKGWNVTAEKFVNNPDQFDDTEKLRQAGKLDAKLQQRAKLMKINYAQLDNEEQEKDRVVARALLQAIRGEQGVAEGDMDESALQAYLGKKKYGADGMKALQQAGREGASKEKMAKIRAQHDKSDADVKRLRELAGMPVTETHIEENTNWVDDLYYEFNEKYDLPDIDDDSYLSIVEKFLQQQGVDPDQIETIGELFIDMRDHEEGDIEDDGQPSSYEEYQDLHGGDDWDQGQYDDMDEAKYQGREVPLSKPMQGDVKKFKVYVRDPKTGNVKKVNFGDPNMRIKKSNPARRKSFRARHNCANPGPRTKARYWSCRKW